MIRIENLCFSYGNHKILHNLSFSSEKGELLSVLGINGSGKSTMLKCINRLLQADSGSIFIDGTEVGSMSRQQLAAKIGYLPQSTIPSDSTVFEAVLTGRKPYLGWQLNDLDINETSGILKLTGTEKYSSRLCNTLSGGELQRVAIARTLAQKPSLLLLDEPANHLDIRNQMDVLALIRRLTSQLGITTIAVMHDLNMALRFSDKFLMMKEGAVLATGGIEVMTEANILETYQIQVRMLDLDGIPMVVPCPDQEPSRLYQ